MTYLEVLERVKKINAYYEMKYYYGKIEFEGKVIRESYLKFNEEDFIIVGNHKRFAFVSVGWTDCENDKNSQIRSARTTDVILKQFEETPKHVFDNAIEKFMNEVLKPFEKQLNIE